MGKSGAKPGPRSRTSRAAPRLRRWRWLTLILLLAGGGIAAAKWPAIHGTARAGTAYAARVACSCRYVAGRSLADCGKDKLAGMELITLSEDAATKSVTARFPLIAADTARLRKGYGCVLDPWEG